MDPEREQRKLQKTANRTSRPGKPHTSGGGGFDRGRSRAPVVGAQATPKRGGEYVAHGFVVSDREHEDATGSSPAGKRRKSAEEIDAGADSLDEADEKIEREAARRHKRG
ncbi:hypothetical protein BDV93DRAFT_563410 [Ceratobasidium sp. AG-I]|nr:hypothetical protein BDV93DRAFT_563410 [Ceratobasidium sp. AG-I]